MSKRLSTEVKENRRLERKAERERKRAFSLQRLKSLLRYEPNSGNFIRIQCNQQPGVVGAIAGNKHSRGYWEIRLEDNTYLAHRLAFFYMTGAWPANDVDHINGIRDDNRWSNLRMATRSQNMQNVRKAQKNNRLGILGVQKHGRKFRATIALNGQRIRIGSFDTPEQASAAYIEKKRELHERCPL